MHPDRTVGSADARPAPSVVDGGGAAVATTAPAARSAVLGAACGGSAVAVVAVVVVAVVEPAVGSGSHPHCRAGVEADRRGAMQCPIARAQVPTWP